MMALSGCATKSEPAGAVTAAPAQWQHGPVQGGAHDATALAHWWRQFDDPILDELIAGAEQTSPDVRSAMAKIAEARARYGVERANLLPSVSASVSDQGVRTKNRHAPVASRSESASASLDASWELDLFGRERLTSRAAAADLAQTEENYHDVQVSLLAEVASTYVALRSAEAKLVVFERTLQTLEDTYELTRWKDQAGSGSALDVQQSLSNLEQTRASIPTLQQTVTEARNKLALLSGKQPGALDALLATTKPVPNAPPALAIGIPADTLRQRPDVRAAGHATEAAIARTGAAERKRLPSLSLSGSIGVDALRANKLPSPQSSFTSLLGSITAPIFNAGSIRQSIKVQAAQEQQALIAYESTILAGLSEVENALSSIQRNNERLTALNKATLAASDSATLAQQRYEAGDVDFFAVLEAQRTQLSLTESQVGTHADLTTAYIQLYKALGGGWANL